MSAPSDAQIGYANETSYGVHKAPTIFLPLLDPSLAWDIERIESEAVVAGLDVIGSEQWNGGNITAGGNVGHELHVEGTNICFANMFGGVGATTSIGGGKFSTPYSPGELDGKSMCIQVGRPRPGNPVVAESWLGAKVADWEVAVAQGAVATLGMNIVARDAKFGSRVVTDAATTSGDKTVTSVSANFTALDVGKLITGTGIPTGTTIAQVTDEDEIELSANATATATGVTATIGMALATASYADLASKPLKFNHAFFDLGGIEVPFMEVSIKGDNALKTDRRWGADGRIHEPMREDRRSYTATWKKEYLGLDERTRLINGEELAISVGMAYAGSGVTFTGNVRLDTTASTTDGRKISEEDITAKFIRSDATLASAITATVIGDNATP